MLGKREGRREEGREEGQAIPINESKEGKHNGKCVRLELPLRRKRSTRAGPRSDHDCQMHLGSFQLSLVIIILEGVVRVQQQRIDAQDRAHGIQVRTT